MRCFSVAAPRFVASTFHFGGSPRHFATALLAAGLFWSTATALAKPPADVETALDRYVAAKDDTYKWNLTNTIRGEGVVTYIVDLTSQTWRTSADVDQPVWRHWLIVARPDELKSDTAFLFISGGSSHEKVPSGAGEIIANVAKRTGGVAAELRAVPNQPLVFHNDNHKRVEDDLIGYTWDKFMVTGDDTWPARLPMTKSAVRAMDTVQSLLASPDGGQKEIKGFVVSGGSKRGWTTWCTAAVDKRVVAIVPAVIDVLNVKPSMEHHYAAYGFWAPAVGNYVQHHIVDRGNTPEYLKLLAIEDPFTYRHRLTMPKYIVNAAGDEFFLPDSSQFYFDELPGEKYLRYVPNAKHSLAGSDARETIATFYEMVINNRPRPKFSWSFESDGSIHVSAKDKPKEVLVWQANNPKARDFRLDIIGKAYQSSTAEQTGDGEYVARPTPPEQGWTAYFVELTYDSGGSYPLKVTTAVRVTPDTLPHKDKSPYQSGK